MAIIENRAKIKKYLPKFLFKTMTIHVAVWKLIFVFPVVFVLMESLLDRYLPLILP